MSEEPNGYSAIVDEQPDVLQESDPHTSNEVLSV